MTCLKNLPTRFRLYILSFAVLVSPAAAETIGGAFIKAYLNNPDINAARASVRATDENVPKANAGYLPQLQGSLNSGTNYIRGQDAEHKSPFSSASTSFYQSTFPRGYGATLTQTVWNGNKTYNSVRQAESQALGEREQLRYTEQNTLLDAVTRYMDVMRDTATVDLNRNNVEVLKEQLRQTQDRFHVGEVTRTDVAQAEAALSQAEAEYLKAQSTLQASISQYRQTIGTEPDHLSPVKPLSKLLPSNLKEAITIAQVEHPAIVAYLHGVDAALLNVKINEAALYPTVAIQAGVNKYFDPSSYTPGSRSLNASVTGSVTIPVYDGGNTYASIRQAKEQVSNQELQANSQRDKVVQAVAAAWYAYKNSPGVVRAAEAQVKAAEVALAGVREEAKVGQRTTLDVLNQEQTLVQARVALINAQHDQVVNSYTLLSNIGRLSVKTLGLAVAEYDVRAHFDHVKSKFFGIHTPDGR